MRHHIYVTFIMKSVRGERLIGIKCRVVRNEESARRLAGCSLWNKVRAI